MRHLAQHWVFKGLMLLLIVSFGIWGIGDIFRGNSLQRNVASVGSDSISVEQLNKGFAQVLGRIRALYGDSVTPQMGRQMGLLDKTLDGLIERSAQEQDLKRLGIEASNRAFLNYLAAQPQFRDKDGKLNKDMIRQIIEQEHMSEGEFMKTGRTELARKVASAPLLNHSDVPQALVDALYSARGQKRIFDIVTVKHDAMTDIPTPDDKALHAYYDQNPAAFTAPEYRGMTIARLTADDLAKSVTVTDEQLHRLFDEKGESLNQPERRDIIQVVVQQEDKAKQLATAARDTHDLAAAAKTMGYEAVPLNQIDEKTTLPELAKPTFALQPGQIADPVKTGLGWHVVQLKKITPPHNPTFDEAKEQLRAEVQRDQAVESATRIVNQLDDQLAAGHALEDIAGNLNLRLVKIAAVDMTGKTPDGKEPAELQTLDGKQDVLKTAFGQSSGEISPVIDDHKGNYIVIRTDEVTTSAAKPFDKVKADIAAAWKDNEQAKQAAAKAETVAKALREGKSTADTAAQNNATARQSKPISLLGDSDAELRPDLMPKLLSMKKGDVAVQPLPDRELVFRLAGIVDADPAAAAAAKPQIVANLNEQMPDEKLQEYLAYLRQIFPVHVKQNVLDSLRQEAN
jgi:peptidyl-prolyl cis-trans isomerase D